MTKDHLTDEDKAVLEQMMKRRAEEQARRAAGGPPPAVPAGGTLAEKWAEPFGGSDEEDGLFAALPRTTPVGIVAIDGPGGVTLYRDGRVRFSIAIPGKPRFVAAGGGLDAVAELTAAPIAVSLIMVPPQAGVPLAAQAAALAGDITQAEPRPLALGQPGVDAVSVATLNQGTDVRTAAVLAGGAAGKSAIVIVMIDHDRARVDAATAATVQAAVLGSAAFTPEPRRRIPAVLPDSPWLEPGLPLRLRAGRPALPASADRAALAEGLLAIAGDLPPDRALDDGARAATARVLGDAALAARVATAHDLRGLALDALRA